MKILGGKLSYTRGGKSFDQTLDGALEAAGDIRIILEREKIQPEGGDHLRIMIHPSETDEIVLKSFSIDIDRKYASDEEIFCNGFQSWTDSQEFLTKEKIGKLPKITALAKLPNFGDYRFYPYTGSLGVFHAHTCSYIRRGERGEFWGSLDEDKGYTIFTHNATAETLTIAAECEGRHVAGHAQIINVICITGTVAELWKRYGKLYGHPGEKPPMEKILTKINTTMSGGSQSLPPVTGWTSWYYHYTNISEKIILDNLNSLVERKIPIDVYQIDDGYQTAVGDWLSLKPNFPSGLAPVAAEIRKHGIAPGLWLAPFICEKNSKIFRDFPEWLARDEKGRPLAAGWNPLWSGNFYGLDISHPGVQAYLEQVFFTVLHEWGFDLVKLDFLYGAALAPRGGKTRGEIMADGMKFLRKVVGEKKILGCGVPLGSAFHRVDYCRIGSDIGLTWENKFLNLLNYRERVSTVNSLRSTIGRQGLNHKFFLNDPDVFILRPENNALSVDQKKTLFVLNNLFGGLLFTSDNIAAYDADTLRLYLSHFPLREKTIHKINRITSIRDTHKIDFSYRDLSYTVYANLTGKQVSIVTNHRWCYHAADGFLEPGSKIILPPFTTKIIYQLPDMEEMPVVFGGSDLHLFPGMEFDLMAIDGRKAELKKNPKNRNSGSIFLCATSGGPLTLNGETVIPMKKSDLWVAQFTWR